MKFSLILSSIYISLITSSALADCTGVFPPGVKATSVYQNFDGSCSIISPQVLVMGKYIPVGSGRDLNADGNLSDDGSEYYWASANGFCTVLKFKSFLNLTLDFEYQGDHAVLSSSGEFDTTRSVGTIYKNVTCK